MLSAYWKADYHPETINRILLPISLVMMYFIVRECILHQTAAVWSRTFEFIYFDGCYCLIFSLV
jgi:hypothetical protein